jgi:hypothetical protein
MILAHIFLLREIVMNRYVIMAFVSAFSLFFYFVLHSYAGHAHLSEVVGEFAVLVTGTILI